MKSKNENIIHQTREKVFCFVLGDRIHRNCRIYFTEEEYNKVKDSVKVFYRIL